MMLLLIKRIKVHQTVSWKTAFGNKNIANNLSIFFAFNSVLNAITHGNGVWEWKLLDSCQKERAREQVENALYFFSFLFFNKTTKLSSLYPISAIASIGLDYFTF